MDTLRNAVVGAALTVTMMVGGCIDTVDLDAPGVSVAALDSPGSRVALPAKGRESPAASAWSSWPQQTVANTLLTSTKACTEGDWLTKYITYRRRLVGDGTTANPGFVSLGTGPGESLPASGRNPDEQWDGKKGSYGYGDTTAHHGNYLAMLGSEARAFALMGVDRTATHAELYLALQAFNRLDAVTETFWGYQPSLDGFFLRDDIPVGYMTKADGRPRFPHATSQSGGYELVDAQVGADTSAGDVMSVDQVVSLFFGLAVVIQLVDPDVSVNGVNLRAESQAIMHRIISNVKADNWHILDPAGVSPPPEWGGFISFALSLAQIADRYVGQSQGVASYSAGVTTGHLNDVWNTWGIQTNDNRHMTLVQASVLDRFDAFTVGLRAAEDRREIYPLVREAMLGQPVSGGLEDWQIESLLTLAPCGGPCAGTTGCVGADGWKSEYRFGHPENRNGNFYGGSGEYPGVDYMLLHNFYLIHKHGAYDRVPTTRSTHGCPAVTGLSAALAGQAPGRYDASDRCTTPDLDRRFCGRSFASWLSDASVGKVTIWTPGKRWSCSGVGSCALTSARAPGGDGPDLILGSAGGDFIQGYGGSDCIYGLGGNDRIYGGRGFDELHGGEGDDDLYGEWAGVVIDGESDIIHGGPGQDTLRGAVGADDLFGGDDDDDIDGGGGQNVMAGGGGDDYIVGGSAKDILRGDDGHDDLYGGAGDDLLVGGAGDDELLAGDGDDRAWAGPGYNRLELGAGNDFAAAVDEGEPNTPGYMKVDAGYGKDVVFCGLRGCEVWGGPGDDYLQGGYGNDKIDAGDGADVLIGMDGNDFLRGDWGKDFILGGAGDDRLCGNEHDDHLDAFDMNNAYHRSMTWVGTAGEDTCNGGMGWNAVDGACTWVPNSYCGRPALLDW